MPMHGDGVTPTERIPRCIIVKPIDGNVLNSVGLSGPGVRALVETGEWQERKEPFVISFMASGETRNDRMLSWYQFVTLMGNAKKQFRARFAVEINIACPNVGHDARELVREVEQMLDVGTPLEVPLIVCINLLVTPKEAAAISRHPQCAAVSQSNSIPWGAFPERIPWKTLFGSDESPLARRGFGSGGGSGRFALPIGLDWLRDARFERMDRPWLIYGGGMQSVRDVEVVTRVGFPILLGLKYGVVCIVRPLRVQAMIRSANSHFASLDKTKAGRVRA